MSLGLPLPVHRREEDARLPRGGSHPVSIPQDSALPSAGERI
jgi:hypothetical protein